MGWNNWVFDIIILRQCSIYLEEIKKIIIEIQNYINFQVSN
jgi:hypothetical protein